MTTHVKRAFRAEENTQRRQDSTRSDSARRATLERKTARALKYAELGR
jgi:hypothetical protein